jgi:hypothetical protein
LFPSIRAVARVHYLQELFSLHSFSLDSEYHRENTEQRYEAKHDDSHR